MTGPLRVSAHRIMQDALADVPADKTGALVAMATPEGARLAIGARVGDRWRFGAFVEGTPTRHPKLIYGAAVELTW